MTFFSSTQNQNFIDQIKRGSGERFGIDIAYAKLPVPYGGGMDGKNFQLSRLLYDHDSPYALYATIHAGLGHNYQLDIEGHAIYETYAINPDPDLDSAILQKSKHVESEATAYGLAMVRDMMPGTALADRLEEFCSYWFTQDWKLLEGYYRGGEYPVYGTEHDINPDEMETLPDVTLNTGFFADRKALNKPIYFHAVAPEDAGAKVTATLRRTRTVHP